MPLVVPLTEKTVYGTDIVISENVSNEFDSPHQDEAVDTLYPLESLFQMLIVLIPLHPFLFSPSQVMPPLKDSFHTVSVN